MEKFRRKLSKEQEIILKQEFVKAMKDSSFSKLVKSLKIDEDLAKRHTSALLLVAKEAENCKNCKSLADCKNEVKGYKYSVEKKAGRLNFYYEACPYLEEEAYKENLRLFDLPKSLKDADLKDVYLDDKNRLEALKAIKLFIKNYEDNPKGLFLSGSFGSGKTYLIAALFNELAKKEVRSIIVHVPELMRGLKDSFDSDYKERFLELKTIPLLLLDDIGAENITKWSRDEVLSPILQYRMDEKLPTFFTTNFSLKDLESHFTLNNTSIEKINARRIIERIKELSIQIELISKNLRGNK